MQLHGDYMLCQDCLRWSRFSLLGHNGEKSCQCGGDFCGCPHCSDDAEKIRAAGITTLEQRQQLLGL
jgi:hypothetical protein